MAQLIYVDNYLHHNDDIFNLLKPIRHKELLTYVSENSILQSYNNQIFPYFTNMKVIETNNLSKRFKKFIAVDRVSLTLEEAEIYGFLGLNGAGKTTFIRLLLAMINPTNGSFKLFGEEASTVDWNKIGYMVESPFSYPNLTVFENLSVFARLRNLDTQKINRVISLLHLESYKNVKAQYLSMGNKQRLGIAKAIIHKPKLLILDEPANGLDPSGIIEFRNLLKELAEGGTTIFLSSHIISEISKLATRIGIIHEGSLTKEFSSSELKKQLKSTLIVDTINNKKAEKYLENAGYIVEEYNNKIKLSDDNSIKNSELVAEFLVKKSCPPKEIYKSFENLEEFFLRTIGR